MARPTRSRDTVFILIHGAWHSSGCFSELSAAMAELGHLALAVDLPGHGLSARLPDGYLGNRPLPDEFFTSPSPVGAVTQADYTRAVGDLVARLRRAGRKRIVLVGHSQGGCTVSWLAQQYPRAFSHVVYLSALMTGNGQSTNDVFGLPEASSSLVPQLTAVPAVDGQRYAKPAVVHAARMDPRSQDDDYIALITQCFYGGLAAAQVPTVISMLTPDEPFQPLAEPLVKTPEAWGRVSRHYIRTLQDQALPLAVQDVMIEAADAFAPERPTVVHDLDTCHSSFLQEPKVLARLLVNILKVNGRRRTMRR